MKHNMALIVYNGKDNPVFRKDWGLPDVTAEEFDATKHTGKVFLHPDNGNGLSDIEGMYVWQCCTPENEEETNKLIEMGKWSSLPVNQPNKRTDEGTINFVKSQFDGNVDVDVQVRMVNYALANLPIEKFNELVKWIDHHPNNKFNPANKQTGSADR